MRDRAQPGENLTQGKPSYRALRAFVETVDAGSAAAAGRRLGVSASAVSHLIRELERQLETRLFAAGPRSPLTETGERLHRSIGTSFVAIERALTEMSSRGVRIRLSTVSTFARLWLLPRIGDFIAAEPDISLALSTNRRVVRLGVEPFDCSIRWGRGGWGGGESQLLFRERLILVGAPSAAGKDPFDQPRIAALTRPDDWPLFLQEDAASSPARLTVEDRASAVQAASLGIGVTVVDATLVGSHLRDGSLIQLSPTIRALEDGFYAVSSPTPATREAVRCFCGWLVRRVAADLQA